LERRGETFEKKKGEKTYVLCHTHKKRTFSFLRLYNKYDIQEIPLLVSGFTDIFKKIFYVHLFT